MSNMKIAIIEDKEDDSEFIKDNFSEIGTELNKEFDIQEFKDINKFLEWATENYPDLLIVDLRLGDTEDRSGWQAINKVLPSEIIPVIVYSAYAAEEPEDKYKNLLIKMVTKGDEQIYKILKKFTVLKLKFNQEKQRIINEFGELSLETVGKILSEDSVEEINENILSIMAISRLASYLINVPPSGKEFPPESIFIYPPIKLPSYPEESLNLGDFLEKIENGNSTTLWLIASPSCDLIFDDTRKSKIENVLLLPCYRNYKDAPFLSNEEEGKRKSNLHNYIKDSKAKILKCPTQIFGTNYILISFKHYRTISYDDIKIGIKEGTWKRLATLATPYAESLQGHFIRDFSRIGTPETSTSEEEKNWTNDFLKH